MHLHYKTKRISLALMASCVLGRTAYAATQSVTANATFDTDLSLTKNSDINFGTVKAGVAGAKYVIDTSGTITPSSGGAVIGGSPMVGQFTIAGSATQTIAISTGSYAADHGVTPSAASCKYNDVAIPNCDLGSTGLAAPGAGGKILKLGVQIVADGTQTAGMSVAPSFVVTIIYG